MDAVGGSEESAGCEPSTVADDGLEARIPAVRVWGPVPAAQAHEVGAWTAAASVLLKREWIRRNPLGIRGSPWRNFGGRR